MVALQAFVDDSATDAGDRRMFLAGYINTADNWIRFSNAWEHELRRNPSIAYFKMSEADSLNCEFNGWSTTDRDRKVLALAHIIRSSQPWFVYCSVSRTEYAEILAPVAPRNLKTPYFDCFWGIVQTAARYRVEFLPADSPPIDFIFDEQGSTGHDAALWYDWLKKEQDPAIRRALGATPVFRNDKDVVALQAADMLAWHLRRHHERSHEIRPIRALLMTHGAGIDIDAASLAQSARQFRRVPGIRFAQTKKAWKETRASLQALSAAGSPAPALGRFRHRWLATKFRVQEAINRLRYPRRRR